MTEWETRTLPGGSGLIRLSDRVEAHGGSIELAGPAGYGTSPIVRLPVEAAGGEPDLAMVLGEPG